MAEIIRKFYFIFYSNVPMVRSKHNCTIHHCKYQKGIPEQQELLAVSQKNTVMGIEQLYDEAYGVCEYIFVLKEIKAIYFHRFFGWEQ